ncbi:MAG TPA: ABC transporter permease [Anaerolineaceae bacterium]|nr:ABC transporter permease [Anaerolineaceae bacterium]
MSELFDVLGQAWVYFLAHQGEFLAALREHLALVGVALGAAVVLAIPLGVLTARSRWASVAVMNTINALRVVPSLAVLFLVVPVLGLNARSAAVALVLLALPPVLLNTDAAFRNLDPAVLESARSTGMTRRQILWRIEFPLALPVILTGIRTATVEVVASATLAAFVGSGGLGIYITRGFALYDYAILMVGAVPVALLTLALEGVLAGLQRMAQLPA